MFNTNSLIGQSPFLSKIQNFFAQPQQPGGGMQMPQAQLPMPGIRQDPPQNPGAVPADQNGMTGSGQGGSGDLLSSLLKNDKDGSSILTKIMSLFGG